MTFPGFMPKYHGAELPTAPNGGLILSLETPIAGLNDGDFISTWPDDSSFHDNFTNSLGSPRQPIYKTGADAINGVPVAKFTPQSDERYLQNVGDQTQFTGLTGTNGATIYVVARAAADPPAAGYGLFTVSPSDPSFFFLGNLIPSSDGHIYDASFSTNCKDIGEPTPSLASPFCYACFSKTNLFAARLNGNQIFTTATNTFQPTVHSFGGAQIRIGTNLTGTLANYFEGEIALFKIWDHVFDMTEINQMDAYVLHKFGIG